MALASRLHVRWEPIGFGVHCPLCTWGLCEVEFLVDHGEKQTHLSAFVSGGYWLLSESIIERPGKNPLFFLASQAQLVSYFALIGTINITAKTAAPPCPQGGGSPLTKDTVQDQRLFW